MKLERLHESLTTTVVLSIGMILAFLGGHLSGSGDKSLLTFILLGVVLLATALVMSTRIWLLIPITWVLAGQIPILPLPAAARDLVVLYVLAVFLALKALKVHRMKPTFGLMDTFLVINVVYMGIVFLRNPVGSMATNSERVGGRPYFTVAIATMAFWVLARSVCTARQARVLPWWMTGMSGLLGFTTLLCQRSTWLSFFLGNFYSDFAADTRLSGAELYGAEEEENARMISLQAPGRDLALALCSYCRPLTLVNPLYFFRWLFFLVSVAMIFLSGFRSAFMAVCLYFLVASYFRSGWTAVLRIIAIGVPAVAILVLAQGNLVHLPYTAQRTLSFLPGRWDSIAVEDAEGSTRWRVEMWQEALWTDRYIQDRWFGDGFGVTRQHMREIQILQSLASRDYRESQESSALVGNFHSGPISTIRCVGVVGLIFFYLLLFRMAYEAVRLIRRAQGTPFFALAMFIGIPIVIHPFFFTFIFGGIDPEFSDSILKVGLLKMLDNSIPNSASQPPPTVKTTLPKSGAAPAFRGRRALEPTMAGG